MSVQEMGLGARGDEFYEALMAVHDGLEEPESHALNARIVLILANRIGDVDTLKDLLTVAADG
ncbi:DUF2783 domain-containing protein [Citreicella sp. C3M06]|uniref:DUF2783 domain-containing protein n=1 Tax=Roseobacteraceae TaxID=2854170 RepID=UPI001C089782|nr:MULTISPECIES: DUF2783 domain-containing protein [Roseobacteraceae]MBU2963546.1 DUF2783 domain-containing protein [Citreicella sp. C3M06]MDO6586747.1 DUF2783 domain-containing protein [Salipiger sp. 1_MG-2023]